MSTPPLLQISGLRKSYGTASVLRGLELTIPAGAGIFGLVGPNGAGKTTLFNVICGSLRADGGSIAMSGVPLRGNTRRPGEIAVLAQDARFPSGLKLCSLLAYYAKLQGFDRRGANREAERVLAMVGLSGARKSAAEDLSHGMRKRLGIAQAFIGTPRLIILDEPTEGLDPHAAREIRQTLRAIAGDRNLVVSSHNLHEVEDLCSEVAILDQGRIVRQDKVSALIGDADEITFQMPGPPAAEALNGVSILSFVRRAFWDGGAGRLVVLIDRRQSSLEEASQQLLARLIEHKARFTQMQVGKRLEDRFIEETGKR